MSTPECPTGPEREARPEEFAPGASVEVSSGYLGGCRGVVVDPADVAYVLPLDRVFVNAEGGIGLIQPLRSRLRLLDVFSSEAEAPLGPIVHSVLLSSDTGVMGEWQAFCSGCRQRSVGDLAHAEFWKDQHLADVLVPKLTNESFISPQQAADELSRETQEVYRFDNPSARVSAVEGSPPPPSRLVSWEHLDGGRPSGSSAAPRSDEELLVRLRGLVFDLQDKPTPGPFKYDNGYLDGQVQAGNDLEALLDEYAPDAAQAAGSAATPKRWYEGDRAARNGHAGRIAKVGSVTVPWVFQYDDGTYEDFYNTQSLTEVLSPSLHKEGEDSD